MRFSIFNLGVLTQSPLSTVHMEVIIQPLIFCVLHEMWQNRSGLESEGRCRTCIGGRENEMNGLSDMSNHRVAALAALLAITVALFCFIGAIVSGMNIQSHNSVDVSPERAPAVRYAVSYAIDSDLYSFYKQQEDDTSQAALSKKDDTSVEGASAAH